MKVESDGITQIGKVISKIANPCFLSISVLALMALTYSADIRLSIDWIVSLIIFLILLPWLYVFARTFKEHNIKGLLFSPTAFLKKHPKDVLVIALLFGLSGLICLYLLEAPLIMLYTYASLLLGSIMIALVNKYFRISYHLGTMTILVIMASVAWNHNFLLLFFILPIVGWAKNRIKEHSLIQMIGGSTIGIILSCVLILFFNNAIV